MEERSRGGGANSAAQDATAVWLVTSVRARRRDRRRRSATSCGKESGASGGQARRTLTLRRSGAGTLLPLRLRPAAGPRCLLSPLAVRARARPRREVKKTRGLPPPGQFGQRGGSAPPPAGARGPQPRHAAVGRVRIRLRPPAAAGLGACHRGWCLVSAVTADGGGWAGRGTRFGRPWVAGPLAPSRRDAATPVFLRVRGAARRPPAADDAGVCNNGIATAPARQCRFLIVERGAPAKRLFEGGGPRDPGHQGRSVLPVSRRGLGPDRVCLCKGIRSGATRGVAGS